VRSQTLDEPGPEHESGADRRTDPEIDADEVGHLAASQVRVDEHVGHDEHAAGRHHVTVRAQRAIPKPLERFRRRTADGRAFGVERLQVVLLDEEARPVREAAGVARLHRGRPRDEHGEENGGDEPGEPQELAPHGIAPSLESVATRDVSHHEEVDAGIIRSNARGGSGVARTRTAAGAIGHAL